MEARSAVNILTSSFQLYILGLGHKARITPDCREREG